MSALGAFCNQLIAFVEDLAETYPEEKDLLMGVQAMKLMKQANPRMLHRLFAEYVNPTVQERILIEDDAYVIDNAKAIFDSQYSDMLTLFWVFKKHWTSMSETNKQHIWKYLKSLVLLARRVPDTLA